jgi:hypothetical protein
LSYGDKKITEAPTPSIIETIISDLCAGGVVLALSIIATGVHSQPFVPSLSSVIAQNRIASEPARARLWIVEELAQRYRRPALVLNALSFSTKDLDRLWE